MRQKKSMKNVIAAFSFSILIPVVGYYYLGALYAGIFFIGYWGGFIIWMLVPSYAPWAKIKAPYWLTLLMFLLVHKPEENRMKFFEVVSAKITGASVPEMSIGLVIGLLALPIGAWLVAPLLLKRKYDFGYYLAWTLFASMGISELAHFVFPFIIEGPYSYFPGMISVILLAPTAWWGMYRMIKGSHDN